MKPEDFVRNKRYERYDVSITRPGPYGNPFSHLVKSTAKYYARDRDDAVDKFEEWLATQPELVAQIKRELKGKTLGCVCKPLRCHGIPIARVANDL